MEEIDPKAQLKADRIKTIVAIFPKLFFVTCIIGVLIYNALKEKPDPIDNSINKAPELVSKIAVCDSLGNGFLVKYATTDRVTEKRLEEIRFRPHIIEAYALLRKEAPLHFGNMLDTDIYDFAEFAIQERYNPDKDIQINSIFVYGTDKLALYTQPNPQISNPATHISPWKLQGAQYITHQDIHLYFTNRNRKKIYRYYKCRGQYSISSTDERYIHFSKDEIVQ